MDKERKFKNRTNNLYLHQFSFKCIYQSPLLLNRKHHSSWLKIKLNSLMVFSRHFQVVTLRSRQIYMKHRVILFSAAAKWLPLVHGSFIFAEIPYAKTIRTRTVNWDTREFVRCMYICTNYPATCTVCLDRYLCQWRGLKRSQKDQRSDETHFHARCAFEKEKSVDTKRNFAGVSGKWGTRRSSINVWTGMYEFGSDLFARIKNERDAMRSMGRCNQGEESWFELATGSIQLQKWSAMHL